MEISRIQLLPEELINIIKSFLPKSALLFLNKYYYENYHYIIKKHIPINQFENFIRDIIRRDNDYVFLHILKDFYTQFLKFKTYIYKKIIYKNYFYFLNDYCIKNESMKCRNTLNEFLKVQRLCQNRHKKKTFIHIRWKL